MNLCKFFVLWGKEFGSTPTLEFFFPDIPFVKLSFFSKRIYINLKSFERELVNQLQPQTKH